MFILREILYEPLPAVIASYSKRSFHSHSSCLRSPRSSFCILPTASAVHGANKTNEVHWPSQYVGDRSKRPLQVSSFPGIQQHRNYFSANCLTRSLGSTQSVKNVMNPWCDPLCFGASAVFFSREYSSGAGGKHIDHLSATAETPTNSPVAVGNEWVDILNHARQSAADYASSIGSKAKELSDEILPYIQQLYDSHPYVEKVIVPVGWTLSGTMIAWFILPRILRKIHKYAAQSPFAPLAGIPSKELVSYEKSLWSALEDPA